MRAEIQLLAASIALGIVHLFAGVAAATSQRGRAWNVGSRDGSPRPLTGAAFRLDQAFLNFRETFPLFAAALLAVMVTERYWWLSLLGAHLYFWARLAYMPVYGWGITGLRSLVWLISMAGLASVWLSLVL